MLYPAKHLRALTASAILLAAFLPSAFSQAELIITEIHYHPDEAVDPNENQEFIEVKNVGDEPQIMTGWTFGGVGDVSFTQTTIAPGGFLVLAKNAAAFSARYGFAAGGTFTGSLKNSGEEVEIVSPAPAAESVFSVDYWDGGDADVDPATDDEDRPLWPSDPDGDGYSLVPMNPNVNTDPNDYRNWRPSINIGGSPGADEPLPDPLVPIFINEIRTRDGAMDNDAIEFFNPNGSDVDISNWFLTDSLDNPDKTAIPSGTVVPAGGRLVLANNPPAFPLSLSSRGELVFLYSGDAGGNLTGFVNGLHFGASGDGRTFSRYINSVGTEQFPAADPSLDAVNSAPSVGPVVITEIMYDPGTTGGVDEFVEIQNISDAVVPLYDPVRTTNNWRVEGVSYVIVGAQPSLAPGEVALITPTTPAAFRAAHPGVPAGVQIFGPYDGGLSNGGEEVALQRPENLNAAAPNETSYINVDVVLYDNRAPWPTDASAGGRSLVRISPNEYGNDPINWEPSLLLEGSPGKVFNFDGAEIVVNEILAHTDIEVGSQQVDVIELHNPTDQVVNIGGWYLTDSKDVPKKFKIPSGTTIAANGFWAVNQDNDANEGSAPANYFGNAFQISSRGDQIYLYSADVAENLTGYRHGWSFRATVNGRPSDGGLTLGRHVDTFGREHLTKQPRSFQVNRNVANPTGFVNNPPTVGPVVISEINFDPAAGGVEFIELKNISDNTVSLYDTSVGGNISNTWSLDGVDWSHPNSPPRPTIAAGEVIVILPLGTDVATFSVANNVPAGVSVIGGAQGYVGALNNAGEELVLLRPDNPDQVGGETIVPMIVVDLVNYRDSEFWPTAGGGISLEKTELTGFSDDPTFWSASSAVGGTPGTTPVAGLTYDSWAAANFTAAELTNPALSDCDGDVNGDGYVNLLAYAFGYDPHTTPAGSSLPGGSLEVDGGSSFNSITFRQQTEATDLTYTVEVSPDLASWSDLVGVQVGTAQDNGDGTESVKFRSTTTVSEEVRSFLRVKITKG